MARKTQLVLASLLVAGVLSACGGGGDDSPAPSASAEGPYKGTITNSSTAAAFEAIVLDDGQIWALYGNSIGGVLMVSGIIQGQGTSNNGSYTSSTVKDFGTVPAITGTLNATYVAGASISGTITASTGGSVGISGTAIPATDYSYDTPASVSNVAGTWNLSSTSGNEIAMTVASNGSFSGTDLFGCTVSGTLSPRPSGKNVFNVQLTIGPAPCALPGWVGGGIAIYTALTNGSGMHQLLVAVVDSSRTYGTASFGTR